MKTSELPTDTPMDVQSPYPVGATVARAFEADGFVRLPGALSPATIQFFEPEITAQVIALNTMHLPMAQRSTYNKAFLQVGNLWRHSERVAQLVFGTRLARIAADLMGVDGVRLYHDQALYKESGGGITPWHADQYYWPFASDRCCTAWIPLQPTPLDMGPLTFAVGSHTFPVGRDLPIGDESESVMAQALARHDFVISQEPYDLGDVSFHQGWTFHRAAPNYTATPRRVMTVIYLDADMSVSAEANGNQDLARWMPGMEPGQVPDTPVTPVLFRR